MIYEAKVLRLDDDIEEQVRLLIGVTELTCFASVCPYPIEEGASYPVELCLTVFDDYAITEQPEDSAESIVRVDDGFAHVVQGVLRNGCLESSGLSFKDEVLASDFGYLDGMVVSLKVDRIDAEFQ
jgi:hypothetical protein